MIRVKRKYAVYLMKKNMENLNIVLLLVSKDIRGIQTSPWIPDSTRNLNFFYDGKTYTIRSFRFLKVNWV